MMNNYFINFPDLIRRNLKKLIGCEVVSKGNVHYFILDLDDIFLEESGYVYFINMRLLLAKENFIADYVKIYTDSLRLYIDENTLVPLIDYLEFIDE